MKEQNIDKGSDKASKLANVTKYDENPFIAEVVKEVKAIKKTQMIKAADRSEIQMIISQDGSVEGQTAFVRYIEVDEDKFAKVYLNQFEAFWDLSKTGIRVFGYILKEMKPNNDRFYFDIEKCMDDTEYKSERSVFDGLLSLINAGIIARSNKHYMYFINPLIVFNGNRITFAKTYVKKMKDKAMLIENSGHSAIEILNKNLNS